MCRIRQKAFFLTVWGSTFQQLLCQCLKIEIEQSLFRNPYELPELSLHTGMNRIKDAQAADGDTMVTSCTFCDWSLSRAAKSLGTYTKVIDVTVLLAKAMKL